MYHVNFNGEISGLTPPEMVDGVEVPTSNISDLAGDDFVVSNFVVVNRNDCVAEPVAAVLTDESFNFCVDGEEDRISDAVVVDAGVGQNQQIVVTDTEGGVLGLPPVFEGPNFDGAGVGTCYVYHVNFNGEISGLTEPEMVDGVEVPVSNLSDLTGDDFVVSNFVVVNREDCTATTM